MNLFFHVKEYLIFTMKIVVVYNFLKILCNWYLVMAL